MSSDGEKKLLGTCDCPMPWCKAPGAEVREGARGTPYLLCDACGVMVRTNSRQGKNGLRALVAPAPKSAPAPASDAPAVPAAAKAAPRRKYGFA
jgi:hypothetical protein